MAVVSSSSAKLGVSSGVAGVSNEVSALQKSTEHVPGSQRAPLTATGARRQYTR